jgi:hypothetical protein
MNKASSAATIAKVEEPANKSPTERDKSESTKLSLKTTRWPVITF